MARVKVNWSSLPNARGGPAGEHVTVTKSDAADAPIYESFLVIDDDTTVVIRDLAGHDETYPNVPAYTHLLISGRLRLTGTTSTHVKGYLP